MNVACLDYGFGQCTSDRGGSVLFHSNLLNSAICSKDTHDTDLFGNSSQLLFLPQDVKQNGDEAHL